MSEHGGPYYQLFPGPPSPPYRQPNVLQSLPASQPGNFTPFFPANYPRQPQVFAEYSLWGPPNDRNRLRELIKPYPTSSVFNVRPPSNLPPIEIHFERFENPPQMSPWMPPEMSLMMDQRMAPIQMPNMATNGMDKIPMPKDVAPIPMPKDMAPIPMPTVTTPMPTDTTPIPMPKDMASIPMPIDTTPMPKDTVPIPMPKDTAPIPMPTPQPVMTPQLQLTAALIPKSPKPLKSLMSSLPTNTDSQTQQVEEEPLLTGLEEPVKKIIDKEELYIPFGFNFWKEDDGEENLDSIEVCSNSSGSTDGDWSQANLQTGALPSVYPWASRPARVVNNRGRKANMMQRRIVRPLSHPVRLEKGTSMMQRIGWIGGLGLHKTGATDPITPNTVYTQTIFDEDTLTQTRSTTCVVIKKKHKKQFFKTNVLLKILAFVQNDVILEIYFDAKLMSSERKKIHRIVAAIEGREEFDKLCPEQLKIVEDIRSRKRYTLATQSEGNGSARQICVYKSAYENMFLVTPNDCRPNIPEVQEIEEDTNPFLKSITKHIRIEEGSFLKPEPPNLFDKLVDYFLDFCDEEVFTEFRFLGPFTKKEVNVINNFITLINNLSKKERPFFKCPLELLHVFAENYCYFADSDKNGFVSITKIHFDLRHEYNLQEAERKQKILEYKRGNLQNPPYVEKKK